jgi:hypothetical protein
MPDSRNSLRHRHTWLKIIFLLQCLFITILGVKMSRVTWAVKVINCIVDTVPWLRYLKLKHCESTLCDVIRGRPLNILKETQDTYSGQLMHWNGPFK